MKNDINNINYIKNYVRTDDGEIYESDNSGLSIFDILKNGDEAIITFFSERYGERVTRLFNVEIIGDSEIISFTCSRCQFTTFNGQFSNSDSKLDSVIEGIIPVEKLSSIICDLSKVDKKPLSR